MINYLRKIVRRYRKYRYHLWYYKTYTNRFLSLDLPELTKEEKEIVKNTWPGITFFSIDWCTARAYKKIHGFSPYYLAPCWYNEIRDYTNPRKQMVSLENKALSDVLFPQLSFPEVYIRCLNGRYYDKDMNYISLEEAKRLLLSKDGFMIKPAIDSNQGKGVYKVDKNNIHRLDEILREVGNNFISQEILRQAPEIAKFNQSSLNCFRVTTIYLNGKFGSATALKIGKKGEYKDNWISGYWVNVNNDGTLCEYGYDYLLNPVAKSDDNVVFLGCKMPKYHEMLSFLESTHKKIFPNCGIIGWDVTIDNEYQIRIIEINISNPGTNIEQYVSGDFFKPFKNDMLDYYNNSK